MTGYSIEETFLNPGPALKAEMEQCDKVVLTTEDGQEIVLFEKGA